MKASFLSLALAALLLAPLTISAEQPTTASGQPQASAQQKKPEVAKKYKRPYIVQGYFFEKNPVSYKDVEGMYGIATASGSTAFGLVCKTPLSPEIIATALNPDSIPEAALLLSHFEERHALKLAAKKATRLRVGDKFPDFTATDIDGRTWTNADCEGKVMVLNQWFTGCGPCRAEMPELSGWKNEMPDVMFFSSTYEDAERARPVLEKKGFNWTHLVGDTQFAVWTNLGPQQGYPMTIIIDKEGIVRQIENGTSPEKRASLKATIESLR